MGLVESKVTKNISRDKKLWRYMTLDKLIDILSTNELFFTSINSYSTTDPFEGLQPRIALDGMKNMYSSQQEELLNDAYKVREYLFKANEGMPPDIFKNIHQDFEKIINNLNKINLKFEDIYFRTLKSTVVNCWHQNESESEAMWRLYSENNKGIAIQTTVQDLIDSIDNERIFLSEIKYIDFYDKNLKPSDCIVNGSIGPLLKREAFKHEQEVRLYFTPSIDYACITAKEYSYSNERIDVDVSKLISKIYISPYATEPYISSVRTIAKKFGIDDSKIIHSRLLTPDENLTRMY